MGEDQPVEIAIAQEQIDHVVRHALACPELASLNAHERIVLFLVAGSAYGVGLLGVDEYNRFHTHAYPLMMSLMKASVVHWIKSGEGDDAAKRAKMI